jgi:hypothetical protein
MRRLEIHAVAAASLLALGAGLGCNADPNPKTGVLTEKQAERRVVEAPFSVSIPEWVEFSEGKTSKFQFEAKVPAPGVAQVRLEGLPAGATFDPKALKIEWTPDARAGNDPAVPSLGYRTYRVQVFVTSSLDPVSSLERAVTFFVRDTPGDLKVVSQEPRPSLPENQTTYLTYTVESADYPQGPFVLIARGFPFMPQIEADKRDPSRFTVSYAPSLQAVTQTSYWDPPTDKTVNGEFVAFAPNGKMSVLPVVWTIKDSPQRPVIYVPTYVTDGPNVSFSFAVEDLNGEAAPTVDWETPPPFGKAVIESATSPSHFQTGVVRWTEIPKNQLGKSVTLSLRACVRREAQCKTERIQVEIAKPVHLAPMIDRANWEIGFTKYVRTGEKIQIDLPITAQPIFGETESAPTVEISGAGASAVSWTDGVLTLSPRAAGQTEFTLNATSKHGLKASETFVFDALAENWGSVLVMGSSETSPETVYNLELARGLVGKNQVPQFVNIRQQNLDDRMLALRTTILAGTEVLNDYYARREFQAVAPKIKNVIILSPLIANVLSYLGDDYYAWGLSVDTRWRSSGPALASVTLAVTPEAGVTGPTLKTSPGGKLTYESESPALLELSSSSQCTRTLVLTKPGLTPEPLMAVNCPRSNGGVAVLSGLEWGDLEWAQGDKALPASWLSNWVKP